MPLDVPAEAAFQQPRQRVQPAYAAPPSPAAYPRPAPPYARCPLRPKELFDHATHFLTRTVRTRLNDFTNVVRMRRI
ncbi:jg20454 [Pararge aegeria aegeria]|uniref:Jg20454 protein n=1 Tax=Pararge aegeria aegeria TaxID=348720 RepID=A0A8S4RXM6_9NEOP|nr:jg20454 [Pararge aegeria aegeria]